MNKWFFTFSFIPDWTQLKNRKCLGNLHDHHVRAKSKPRIQEMSGEASPEEGKKGPLISEVPSNPSTEMVNESGKASEEPDCVIMREPKTGHPEFLVAEVKLPKVVSTNLFFFFLRASIYSEAKLRYVDQIECWFNFRCELCNYNSKTLSHPFHYCKTLVQSHFHIDVVLFMISSLFCRTS